MSEPEDEMITFRIAPRDRAAIQRLIETGEFRNRSDFLRYAVRSTLDGISATRDNKARVNLEIEGVDIPAQQNAQGARARPRTTRKGVGL